MLQTHIKPKAKEEGALRLRHWHPKWAWPHCFYSPTHSDPPLFPAAYSWHNNRFPITAPSFTPSLNYSWTIFIPEVIWFWKYLSECVCVRSYTSYKYVGMGAKFEACVNMNKWLCVQLCVFLYCIPKAQSLSFPSLLLLLQIGLFTALNLIYCILSV